MVELSHAEALRVSAIVRIVALMIERASTFVLAILLLRLHVKMAESPDLHFMRKWVKNEQIVTIVVVVLLVVAFLMSVAAEAMLISVLERPSSVSISPPE